METLTYEVDGRIARITLNRPARGNGITLAMPRELSECVERANLDPSVHVIALAGAGKGFCGGYDLVEFTEGGTLPNHDPSQPWDPVVDWQMMSRNLRGFMSLSWYIHLRHGNIRSVHKGFAGRRPWRPAAVARASASRDRAVGRRPRPRTCGARPGAERGGGGETGPYCERLSRPVSAARSTASPWRHSTGSAGR